jgi:hypothetical protein
MNYKRGSLGGRCKAKTMIKCTASTLCACTLRSSGEAHGEHGRLLQGHWGSKWICNYEEAQNLRPFSILGSFVYEQRVRWWLDECRVGFVRAMVKASRIPFFLFLFQKSFLFSDTVSHHYRSCHHFYYQVGFRMEVSEKYHGFLCTICHPTEGTSGWLGYMTCRQQ